MIDIRELRIGNYVLYNGSKAEISEISLKHIFARTFYKRANTPTDLENISLSAEDCEPVPLTKEMLLKCGFEVITEGYSYYLKIENTKLSVGIVIMKDGSVGEMTVHNENDTNEIGLTYLDFRRLGVLHQLQNLYFFLAGKELEINID